MKKAITKLALLLILTSSLIPVLSFAPIPAVTAAEHSFFEDNFENYTVGTFPSSGGWELWYSGMGTDQQIIVNNVSCSPTKSLKLLGIDFWAGFAARRFLTNSSIIGFEVAVRVEETNGQSRDNARVAFTTKLDAYLSCEYAPVTFQDNGVIISGGQVLQSYVADTWYKIKLVMDRSNDTYSVWVDGELKGENLTVTTTSGPITDYPSTGIDAFSVSQCYNSVTAYFDDVKVFSSYEPNPTLELVPNTGISTTTLVGSGFAPSSQISVTWDGIPIPTVPSQVITDSSGSFTCIVSAMNQTDGTYTVRAVDGAENKASESFTVSIAPWSEATIVVPDDYPTIQEAIKHAQNGNTIKVKAGTYYEHINVNKSVSLIGENKETTTIDGNGTLIIVVITADNVSLSGFTIRNCGNYPGENLRVESNGNSVFDNIILNNYDNKGIVFAGADDNVITNNDVLNNFYGIIIDDFSCNNIVSDNRVSHNQYGMWLSDFSDDNLISSNIISNCSSIGIIMGPATANSQTISGNVVFNNSISSSGEGIRVGRAVNSTLIGNIIKQNSWGIYLQGSKNNTVTRNDVSDNSLGVYMDGWCNGTKFYHNIFVGNSEQINNRAHNYALPIDWDNGYPSGGNFWSNYNGTDADGDGIGDVPYVIDENSQDNYPLMSAYGTNGSTSCKLTLNSMPSGVTFTADETTCTAPWSETYTKNSIVSLTMPESYSYEGKNYVWNRWSDGITDRNRTVTMNEDKTLTAIFETEGTSGILVLSPENRTYNTSDISLAYTKNETCSYIGYSLDGQMCTEQENTTMMGLQEGAHQLIFFANYSNSFMGEFANVWFTVDTTPPTITDVSQTPVEVNGTFEEGVGVQATVIDAVSGVERVTLSYTDGNGTWVTTEMAKLEGDVWNGTIPAFPHGTTITYTIMAEDKAGNIVATEELYGEPNQYEVLPEFPLWVIVPLFVTATAFAIVARKRLSSPAFTKVYNSLHKILDGTGVNVIVHRLLRL